MVEISLSGSGEGPGWGTAPGYSTAPFCVGYGAAWLAFARDGDPGHAGLPDWPAFPRDARQTMLFGRECALASE
jgi:para-nitrobenzyl esterase